MTATLSTEKYEESKHCFCKYTLLMVYNNEANMRQLVNDFQAWPLTSSSFQELPLDVSA